MPPRPQREAIYEECAAGVTYTVTDVRGAEGRVYVPVRMADSLGDLNATVLVYSVSDDCWVDDDEELPWRLRDRLEQAMEPYLDVARERWAGRVPKARAS